MRIASLLLVVVTILWGSSPVVAQEPFDPGYPAFATFTFDGSGWVAHRFEVSPGTRFSLEAMVESKNSRRSTTGYWILDADDRLVFGMQFSGQTSAAIERHVQVGPAGIVANENYGGSFGTGGMTANWEFTKGGTYTVVAVAMSDAPVSARVNLFASDGLIPLHWTTGTDTVMLSDADFRGTANLVWAEGCLPPYPYWLVCPGASAQVDVRATSSFDWAFFGGFIAGSPVSRTGWAGPEGSGEQTGGGSFSFIGRPPGDYTFSTTVSGGTVFRGLTVFGADVLLPTRACPDSGDMGSPPEESVTRSCDAAGAGTA